MNDSAPGHGPGGESRLREVVRAWPWGAAIFSGILLALAYPPVARGGLAWIALAPLVAAIWFSQPWPRREPWRLFLLGYITGLGYFVGSLHWIWTVTVPGWLILSAVLAIYPALWSLFLGLVARPGSAEDAPQVCWANSWRNLRAAVLAAAAWTALEWLRGVLFTGFGWNALGVALVDNLPMIQFADHTGVAGISFLLVMVNVIAPLTVFRLTHEVAQRKMRAHFDFSATVVLVAAAFGYGARILLAPPAPAQEVTFGAVQSNIPFLDKRDPAREQDILDTYTRLSESVLAFHPDLLLWPESATPQPALLDENSWRTVSGIAARHTGDFLLGTVHFSEQGDFNSAALLTHRGKDVALYHKIHLVPFGEYIPLRHSFPFFAWVVGDLVPEDFNFGGSPVVFEMTAKPVRLGPLICFEDTLGDLVRQFVLRGARLLVTVTNDGWFLRSAGSEQHRANAILRTIENRVPLIRAANTGVTCAIDPLGRETQRLREANGNTFFEGFLIGKVNVPTTLKPTFYTQHGDAFAKLCLLITTLSLLPKIHRSLHQKKPPL